MGLSLRNKSILITGANGFIGSHLTRRLLAEGARVHALIREDSTPFRIGDIVPDLSLWTGDIRDYRTICRCIRKTRPQIIFHLAAKRDVKRDIELIEPMIDINLKGTVNLLRAVADERITPECFVNTGSSEEYGDGTTPFSEDQRENPVSPYSASKVAATYFCQMFFKSMGLPVITLRPFLTYGPDQDTDMFIPSLIDHCLKKTNFQMTRGDQTREFNYVEDIVDAYFLAATSRDAIGKIINIGNGIEFPIQQVAEKVVAMMGHPIQLLVGSLKKRAGEADHFFCENRNARQLLNWHPKTDLDEGLRKTIAWYKNESNIKMSQGMY